MKVIHIPCLEDNYAYLVIDEKTKQGAVVDPVEPEKVISVAKEHGVDLKLVLTTHHHWFRLNDAGVYNTQCQRYGLIEKEVAKLDMCSRVIDEKTKQGAVVDPVEPEKVISVAKEHGVELKLVLTTHHHWDHAGGNEKIKELVPGIKVYGGSIDNVKGCTNKLENGDKLSLGDGISILSLHTPCHTKGHISYYLTGDEGENPAVFTGDTLFVAGCGKFFEGTAEQMYESLCVTLASLPKPNLTYTVKNLQFAQTVEPDNAKISQKLSWAEQQRQSGLPTIPSTIETELEINPFMRADLPEVQEKVGCKSPVEALREIRQRKDNWKGAIENYETAVVTYNVHANDLVEKPFVCLAAFQTAASWSGLSCSPLCLLSVLLGLNPCMTYVVQAQRPAIRVIQIDIFAFIHTLDPTKVKIVERERNEDEPLLLATTIGRTVPGVGQGANIHTSVEATDIVVEVVAPVQPRHQGKRKSVVVDAGEASHPPKKLREDHRAPSGTSVGGNSWSAIKRLLARAVLNAKVRVTAIPTLPFVTAYVSSTLERETGDHTDFVAKPNLCTIGASQRFIISLDSSHHSGPTIAEAKVDSLTKFSVPIMTTITTITSTVNPALVAKKKSVKPSLFSADSSSTGRANLHTGVFLDLTGSDFLVGGIRTIIN
ncbi:hydroxyacylglutathione hydrolase, cytoplasmic, partial [Tanacetum coccineum]